MEKVPIRELITRLERELIRVGYAEATLNYYRSIWKRIIAYFEDRGETFFSEAVAMKYVDNKCDFFAKEKAGALTQSNVYLFRVVRMMGDFQQHGVILRRYERSLSRVNDPQNQEYLAKFKHIALPADTRLTRVTATLAQPGISSAISRRTVYL